VVSSLVISGFLALTRRNPAYPWLPSRVGHNIGVRSGIRREIHQVSPKRPARDTTVNEAGTSVGREEPLTATKHEPVSYPLTYTQTNTICKHERSREAKQLVRNQGRRNNILSTSNIEGGTVPAAERQRLPIYVESPSNRRGTAASANQRINNMRTSIL